MEEFEASSLEKMVNSQSMPKRGRTTEHCSLVKMFIDRDELETEFLKQEGLSGEEDLLEDPDS